MHDEQPARAELRQRRARDRLGQALGDAARAAHELAAGDLEQLGEARDQVGFAPARLAEDPRVLGADREQAVECEHELRVVQRAQVDGVGARERLGVARELIDDAARALAREHRDGVGARRGAEVARERRPRRALLVLREAEAELARVAVRGAVDLAGPPAADVAHHELERAADRRVRAVALAEHVLARVHPDPSPDRAVHDHHGTYGHRRGQHAVDVELVGADRLDRREDDGQILGQAARHHRVDRHLLDGGGREVGRDDRDQLVGCARRAREHREHAALGRRHHGQAVGPAAREQRLGLVFERRECYAARGELVAFEAHAELGRDVGVDAARAAARPPLGQARAEPGDPRELLPVAAVPADCALGLHAVLDADQGRDGLDLVVVRDSETRVVFGR